MKIALITLKIYFRVLSFLAPNLASKQAFQLFQKTNRKKMKPMEKRFYDSSESFIVECTRGKVTCFENGDPNGDLVLLVHGWDSNAGSMSGITDVLVERGYHVISFDLPAHGKTDYKHTNLIICRDVMLSVLNKVRSEKPISIIAHSFGTLITVLALSTIDRKFDKLILLASAGKATWFFEEFKKIVGLSNNVSQTMIKRAGEIFEEEIEDITVVKKVKMARVNSLVLFHDAHDKVLPYANSLAIADDISTAKLNTFEKVGHYRMLWNPEVIAAIAHSLNSEHVQVDQSPLLTQVVA